MRFPKSAECDPLGAGPAVSGRLDLNLLNVFIAVFETKSVSRAAERLAVAQPTVSYSLGRMREFFGDSLFTRTNYGVTPTAFAENLYRPFAEALRGIESTIEESRSFVPSRTARTFRVAMSDLGCTYFLPPLLSALEAKAPQARMEVVQVPLPEVVDGLASGRIDAAVGNLPFAPGLTRSTLLFREHYVCLLASSHPRICEQVSVEQFMAERHVLVTSPASGHLGIENCLREKGLHRDVALWVPQFSALPALIPGSELLVILPSRVARTFESFGCMRSLPLPLPLPDFEVCVHWHARHASDEGVAWLCSLIEKAVA